MKRFDVVIIGAGPGGLRCAKTLASSNKTILVLEKNSTIGPKICGGGLTQKSYKFLNIPTRLIEYSFYSMNVHTQSQKIAIHTDEPMVKTINRTTLGNWMKKQLPKSVLIKSGVEIIKITKKYIITNKGDKISYKYLVGSDGANSIVRRFLEIPTKKMLMAMQYKVSLKKLKGYNMFFDANLFSSGYAWIIPHKEYISVGCGCSLKHLSVQKMKSNLDSWLKQKSIDMKKAKFEAWPINFDYQGYDFGNIFLVGDAAGFSSGLSGEGIFQALISGEEVAKKINNPIYQSAIIVKLLRKKRIHDSWASILGSALWIRKSVFYIFGGLLRNQKFVNILINKVV